MQQQQPTSPAEHEELMKKTIPQLKTMFLQVTGIKISSKTKKKEDIIQKILKEKERKAEKKKRKKEKEEETDKQKKQKQETENKKKEKEKEDPTKLEEIIKKRKRQEEEEEKQREAKKKCLITIDDVVSISGQVEERPCWRFFARRLFVRFRV